VARRLFTVTDTFFVQGRGLVLVPGITLVGEERFKVGDPLLLQRPNGTESIISIGGLEFLCPNPNREVVVMLSGSGNEDVPIGTEVWSVDSAEAGTQGRH
jgi:hypothetical protein